MRILFSPAAGALLAVLALAPASVRASGWLDPGDIQLRADLTTLVDAGALDLPMLGWPIPRADVCAALPGAAPERASGAVATALDRVRGHCEGGRGLRAYAYAGQQADLHGFAAEPRSDALAGFSQDWAGERWSARLDVSLHADPQDGLPVRPDGSYLAGQWGNWVVSAGWLDRYWGPGWDGSLIWSNQTRPIPGVALDRVRSTPFETRWLSWIGPWRATLFLGALERERVDIDNALFLGIRVAARPFDGFEIALSRTAQFCGDGLPCTWSSFKDLLIGNDNVGLDVSAEDEPGNQLAGFDVRWSSPIGNAPYALYAQVIGEDESEYLPEKVLKTFGLDGRVPLGDSGVRLYVEYAKTSCASQTPSKVYNCAYNQGRFFAEGYRYRGEVIGHSLDNDGRLWSAGAVWAQDSGWRYDAVARFAEINTGGAPDPRHTISATPLTRFELAAGAKRDLGWAELELRLAATHDDADDTGETENNVTGFIGISKRFGSVR